MAEQQRKRDSGMRQQTKRSCLDERMAEEEEHLEEPAGVIQSDTSLMASWIFRCTFLYLVERITS